MRVRATQDVAAGAIIITFAVAVLVALSRIPTAKYQAISPDLFPRVCAYALIAGGIGLLLRGFLRAGPAFVWPPWRSVVLIVASVVAFGLVAPRFGYAPAGLLTVVVSGLAARNANAVQLVLVGVGLATFSAVLFSYVLSVPIPAFTLRGLGI